jgi:membrane fusion protein, copper/silver efflux system
MIVRKRRAWPWVASAVGVVVVVGVGGGVWYAQHQGWLGHGSEATGSDHSKMAGMTMPASTDQTGVKGHAEVTIPGEVRQRIGVTVGKVEQAPLRMTIRTIGIVQADETKVAHVHLRTEGWVQEVYVNYTGQQVRNDEHLLSIYSPNFLTTQQEYLNAVKSRQKELAQLAQQRLELWNVPAGEIKEIERTGKPRTYLTLRSPLAGTVLEKNAFVGQYITAQTQLYVVADLSTVWVQAKVYEYELPHIDVGQLATATLDAIPGQEFRGKVMFVQPTVEEKTRTVQVRVELSNKEGQLRPGMFAQVVLDHAMGTGLLLPASAVIRTGMRDLAYRVTAPGRFLPVVVKLGPQRYGDRLHVLEGLKAGDEVVTSANFLIDSESRLRVGMGGMAGMPGMEMGDNKGK